MGRNGGEGARHKKRVRCNKRFLMHPGRKWMRTGEEKSNGKKNVKKRNRETILNALVAFPQAKCFQEDMFQDGEMGRYLNDKQKLHEGNTGDGAPLKAAMLHIGGARKNTLTQNGRKRGSVRKNQERFRVLWFWGKSTSAGRGQPAARSGNRGGVGGRWGGDIPHIGKRPSSSLNAIVFSY